MRDMPGKEWAVFGASLDPLDAPEKVEMKRAYLDALGKGRLPVRHPRDPYDLLAPQLACKLGKGIREAGKLPVEDWLKPRPSPRSRPLLTPARFQDFIDGNGCLEYARRLEDFMAAEVLPRRPLMVGVDHSLSAGAVGALAALYGRGELRIIVFDAHTDAISTRRRQILYRLLRDAERAGVLSGKEDAFPGGGEADSFNCGSFLHHLIDQGRLDPQRLLIIGPADLPPGLAPPGGWNEAEGAAVEDFHRLRDLGVTILGRRELQGEGGTGALREALEALGKGPCYVSVDLDVGALEAVKACRFMDLFGMSERELAMAVGELASWLEEEGNSLAGLDVMEMDVHLVGLRHRDGSRDRTVQVALKAVERLLVAG